MEGLDLTGRTAVVTGGAGGIGSCRACANAAGGGSCSSPPTARAGSGGEGAYAAVKAGMFGLAKTLAREAARSGVTSNVVCPGPTDTPMLAAVAAGSPGLVEKLARSIPLGRLGRPADVAGMVAFLCTDRAGYITGQTISVSGGITMQ